MAVSELPGNPSAVWTVQKNSSGECEWVEEVGLCEGGGASIRGLL